ncbi:MAG: T9SS type A sorting domain-containing protein, partial [Bacteroidota bacterium]
SYDWRLVQSSGPVNFMIGDTIIFEYAIVNHLDSSLPWQSQTVFEDFFQDVHTIKNLYNQGNIPSCIALDVATKNNLLSNEIKVFPNPAQQYFVLQSNGENIEQVVIYDLNGRFVLQQQINALQAQIDIADLCNGMFFIQAATKSKNTHFKLMKSN